MGQVTRLSYSLFTIIAIDLFFQLIHLLYFVYDINSNGRIINNLMLLFVIATYLFSILKHKSKMNRFQFFVSSIIIISLYKFYDDLNSINWFYLIGYSVFNFVGIYDVFYVKKDLGEFMFDFLSYKNWFN
jgi:hypothetical protein